MRLSKRLIFRKLSFLLVPLVSSPLLFFGKEMRCIFVILIMSIFWLLEVLPMGVVSLLPLFLFPVLEISPAKVVSKNFFKDNVVLFMTSLIMAMAVEETGLHRRIALTMLRTVGDSKHCILFGLMATTAFVSFFVSDTAATILMLPIALAILSTLEEVKENSSASTLPEKSGNSKNNSISAEKSDSHSLDISKMDKKDRAFCKAMVIATSQASLIGGIGIITGTGTNLVFREQIMSFYPDVEMVGYVQWMAFALPWVPLYLFASWLVLTAILMPWELIPNCFRRENKAFGKELAKAMRERIMDACRNLGPMSFAEGSVMFWYVLLLLAWSSRSPGFMDGWGELLPERGRYVKDSTVAVFVAIIMFIWPRSLSDPRLTPILGWELMKTKFSWSCTLLIGSGFAISDGVQDSGLGSLLACRMHDVLRHMDHFWLQSTLTVCFLTEFASNVATAGIVIPIMLSLSKGLSLHPLYLVLPVTISCSFAFMFPMATPGNAIAYDTKMVSMWDMISVGFFLNIICVWLTVLNFNTYAYWALGLDKIPEAVTTVNSQLICGNSTF